MARRMLCLAGSVLWIGCGSELPVESDGAGDPGVGDEQATDGGNSGDPNPGDPSSGDPDLGDPYAPGDLGPAPDAPVVDGEHSAGHPRPFWFWTVPADTAGFRYRIDGGGWLQVSLATTAATAATNLAPGAHLFEVQARSANYAWSTSGAFTTTVEYFSRAGFWNGVQRDLATTPYGQTCAVSAHNCYQGGLSTPAANLAATLSRIHDAQAGGADLIELDIKEQAGVIRVEHEDTGGANSARLIDVLDDAGLRSGNQILFIEIKEQTPSAPFIAQLVQLLRDRRQYYARNGRPVVLRTFNGIRQNVSLARTELDNPENILIANYVWTSVLYGGNAATQSLISEAANAGHQMVEFPYIDANLASKLTWARALGLGINLWTIPGTRGEVFVASLRDETDVLTTDYPVDNARAVIEANNSLFYFDAAEQTAGAGATTVPYLRDDQTPHALAVNGSGQPALATAPEGGSLYGGHLVFAGGQSGELYDADANPNEGMLVSAVARFDTLNLADGATMAVLSKTDSGAWCIELHNPAGAAGTVLRFGVRVGPSYFYATISASHLNTSNSYLLTGAYDGDGGVWLWVDNSTTNVTSGSASGGVINNDVPVRIGADPVGTTGAGYYFDGRIQRVLGQTWGAH